MQTEVGETKKTMLVLGTESEKSHTALSQGIDFVTGRMICNSVLKIETLQGLRLE